MFWFQVFRFCLFCWIFSLEHFLENGMVRAWSLFLISKEGYDFTVQLTGFVTSLFTTSFVKKHFSCTQRMERNNTCFSATQQCPIQFCCGCQQENTLLRIFLFCWIVYINMYPCKGVQGKMFGGILTRTEELPVIIILSLWQYCSHFSAISDFSC